MSILLLISLGVLAGSGFMAIALAERYPDWAVRAGVGGILAGSACGLFVALRVLLNQLTVSIVLPWSIPGGAFHLLLDPLAALFMLPILGLSAVCAVYGKAYMKNYGAVKGSIWFQYNLLVASMTLVVLAHNAILFLAAWEVMAITSFFLVMTDNHKPQVRSAGWIYLTATHLGTAFILVLFVVLGEKAGSYDFDAFEQAGEQLSTLASALAFICAVIGFGSKAGFIPFHVWLPEAHPAAPSHVSALMSGVMIKTGIYGLIRLLGCMGTPESWWGWSLLGIGVVSGVLGVLLALAQHDIKRLLAYHSVENIGIITMGLGVGYIGLSHHLPVLMVLGFAGALLHVVNHALFKGLLFLGAGVVLHETGTGDIDALGGLMKRMRITGILFLVGSAAICGLLPLNGFVSEFLIYFGSFTGITQKLEWGIMVACLATITGLAIIGGLAAACFTKAFGVIFLGEPRSEHARRGHEPGVEMWGPMAVLALLCVCIGFFAPEVVQCLEPALRVVLQDLDARDTIASLSAAIAPMRGIVVVSALVVLLSVVLYGIRSRLLSGRIVEKSGTWDCGYAQPTTRIQYTASSYAQPLTRLFHFILRTRSIGTAVKGVLPADSSFATEPNDVFFHQFYAPVFRHAVLWLTPLRKVQQGRVQLYVLYITLTLIALILFSLE